MLFVVLIYPLVGLLLIKLLLGRDLLQLVFPVVAGFTLVGPFAALVLYEMSRLREAGEPMRWQTAFEALRRPAIWPALALGAVLMAVFLTWLIVAAALYGWLFGETPLRLDTAPQMLFGTTAGWTLIGLGSLIGFLFALLVLSMTAIAFPMLLDKPVGLQTAVATSEAAFAANPLMMSLWGVIVAGVLGLGFAFALVGLAVAIPLLGHATWHLYRKVVP